MTLLKLSWCSNSICQKSKRNICTNCLLQGFLFCTVGVAQPVAAVFHPWVLWSWFIRGRGPWAAISPFPSALWLPDNIQLSLMCHQGPMVRLSALLLYCSAHWDENIYTHAYLLTQSHMVTRLLPHTPNHQMKSIIVFPSFEWDLNIIYILFYIIYSITTGLVSVRSGWKWKYLKCLQCLLCIPQRPLQ